MSLGKRKPRFEITELKIRGLDPSVIQHFDKMADQRETTRNRVIRDCLTRLALADEVAETESKYEILVKSLVDTISQNTELMAQNIALMERLEQLLLEQRGRK